MTQLRVASIVEGHGEVASLPILLERLWYELFRRDEYIEIVRPPIRQPRDRLARNKDDALARAVGLAAAKLASDSHSMGAELILILIDADEDCARELGPKLLEIARESRRDKSVSCVLAVVEYETWFVASARSLAEFLELGDEEVPADPETKRAGKGWIERRFKGVKYSETVDQPKMTAKMDLEMCRDRSPSFDKLCRELEQAARMD